MSDIDMRFGANIWRTSLITLMATAALALSAADSRALNATDSAGFLYSAYLQDSNNSNNSHELHNSHNSQDSSFQDIEMFSVAAADSPFWRESFSRAGTSLNDLSLPQYLAEQVINGGESAVLRTGRELSQTGWQLGADLIEDGALAAAGGVGSPLKRVDVHIETPAGGGFSNAGVDVISALRETPLDAVALQIRGYTGFSDSRYGFNAGGFYRREASLQDQAMLIGGNVFFDYETFKEDGFWRWSVGGEARSAWVDVFANYYDVLTDPIQEQGLSGRVTYSASGYDIQAHVHSPNHPNLSGIVGYYLWEGEFNDGDDGGLLLGARVQTSNSPVLFELNYRGGDGKSFGGRAAYTYEFGGGNSYQAPARGGEFRPQDYFFEPAEREYTHRIRETVRDFAEESLPLMRVSGLVGRAEVSADEQAVRDSAASVRNVQTAQQVTVSLPTLVTLRANSIDGVGNVEVAGVLRGSSVRASFPFPWGFPASPLATVRTSDSSTVVMLSRNGNRVAVNENTRLETAFERVYLEEGELVLDGNGFMLVAGHSSRPMVTVEVFGDTNAQMRYGLSGGGGVMLSGQFRVGFPGARVIRNDGASVVASLAWDVDGTLMSVRITDDSKLSDTETPAGISCENPGSLVFDCPPRDLLLTFASGLSGSGSASDPFVAPTVNYSGVIATVTATGGPDDGSYSYVKEADAMFTLNERVMSVSDLGVGVHAFAVGVRRGGKLGMATVYVAVNAVASGAELELEGAGTSRDPYLVMSVNVMPGTQVVNLNSSGDVSMCAIVGESDLFRVNAACGLVVRSPLPPESDVMVTVTLVSGDSETTRVIHFETGSLLPALAVNSSFDGDGTESFPYLITRVEDLEAGTIMGIAEVVGGNGTNYGLISSVTAGIGPINGVLTLSRTVNEFSSFSAVASAIGHSGAGATALRSTVYFRSAVMVEPITYIVDSRHSGNGTEANPIEVPAGFTGVIGTVSSTGGPRNAITSFDAITGGDIRLSSVGETGILSAVMELQSGVREIVLSSTQGAVMITATLYLRVLSEFNVQITTPDGVVLSNGATLMLDQGSQVAQGVVVAFMTPSDGNPELRTGENRGYTHLLIPPSTGTFEYRISDNALVVNLEGGLPAGRTYMVEAHFGDGGMVDGNDITSAETEVEVTLFIQTSANLPFGAVVSSDLSGEGTSGSPYIIDDVSDVQVGAELANIAVGGVSGVSYVTGAGNIAVARDGALNVSRELSVGSSYIVTVTVNSAGGQSNILTVHFQVNSFQLGVDVEPAGGFVSPMDIVACQQENVNYCVSGESSAIRNLQASLFRLESRGVAGAPTWTLSGAAAGSFEIVSNGNTAQIRIDQRSTESLSSGLYVFSVVAVVGRQRVETEFRMRVYGP